MDPVKIATTDLLEPAELTVARVEALLGSMGGAVDIGEVYLHNHRSEVWTLEDGAVSEGSFSVDRGLGVRAISGEKTGFAYAEGIHTSALRIAVDAARSIVDGRGGRRVVAGPVPKAERRYAAKDPIAAATRKDKLALLEHANLAAHRTDNRIEKASIQLSASHDTVLVLATDGTFAADIRPMVRLDVSVIASQGARRERGFSGAGGRCDFGFLTRQRLENLGTEAARMALLNLEAVDAPAGPMPVVLGPGWPGVLLHEAVGHGLEGDFNRKGSSAFAGRIGERVASPLCTVVDDGTLSDLRGSLTVDDEGTPSGETVLIENGVLKGYMQDRLNARLTGVAPTGNGRRQSYASLPMPRMTNTFMRAGEHDPEEIVASCSKGLYAANFGGGQVDITSGRFVFSATEAYLIEDGRITRPVRGASLIGDGPEVMTRVSMVGNDLQLDPGIGVCMKLGQKIPVGVGQPTLKVDEIIVGGTLA
ncbi:MAG: metalloprotease TldD [Gammaproteobacteria bacterium]|nr:metalloprotease TldD [Gammaproteobacteria bacterium]